MALDHGGHATQAEIDAELLVELLRDDTVETDNLVCRFAGDRVRGKLECFESTAVGDIDTDDDGDTESNSQNGQGELQGMALQVPKTRLPKESLHAGPSLSSSTSRPFSMVRMRSASPTTC